MKIWKNTSTLDGYDQGLDFTPKKDQAEIALLGSKPIDLIEFPKLKGIFRAGIGKDNVPENDAIKRGIIVRYPSQNTIKIIFEETAAFTCSLIFRMLYDLVGTIEPWKKYPRRGLAEKKLLIIGTGNIGGRIYNYMKPLMNVMKFDIIDNELSELTSMIKEADCITLHIPKTSDNESFISKDKLALMKKGAILVNTARGSLVDEDALYNELESGRIRAAFDVFWEEPYNGKLKKLHSNQFFMTPHVASTCNGFLSGCRESFDILIQELRND